MNVVIVHGSNAQDKEKLAQGYPPQNLRNWIPWLKERLEEKEYEVFNPLMPKNWEPIYKEWKEEFEKIPVDEGTILIGASAGGGFLVRWLGETKKKIKKLILIAPVKDYELVGRLKKLCHFEIDESISSRIKEIVIFISNDKERIIEDANTYQKELNAKLIELKDHGHFTFKWMGTDEFPELLQEVLKTK